MITREGIETGRLVALASPQKYVLEEFAKVGLTPAEAGRVLLDVMKAPNKNESRIDAVSAYFAVTVGQAPSNSRNVNANVTVKGDKFFDETVFANPPPLLGAPKKLPTKKGKS